MKRKLILIAFVTVLLVISSGCTPGTGVQINTPAANSQSGTPAPNGQIDVPGFNLQLNAPGLNPLVNKPGTNGQISSFLIGIWHGIISPGTLVVSVLNPNVTMYEVHNDGSQYNFGFLIGIAIIFLVLGIILGRRR